jgi:hypothetical protein
MSGTQVVYTEEVEALIARHSGPPNRIREVR